jgi:hypothetical protein
MRHILRSVHFLMYFYLLFYSIVILLLHQEMSTWEYVLLPKTKGSSLSVYNLMS